MIYFNINIRNPMWWERFQNIKNWSGKTPWEKKFWEVQLIKNDNLLRVEFGWTVREDHAGVTLQLGLAGYEIHFSFYDSRHWYAEKGRWVDYSNPTDVEELYGTSWKGEKKDNERKD